MRAAIGAAVVLALVGLTAGLLWLALGSDDDDAGRGDIGDLVAEIAKAVTRDGQILHTTALATQGDQSLYSMEVWVDGGRRATRMKVISSGLESGDTDLLIVDGLGYIRESGQAAVRDDFGACEGVEPWLAALILCDSKYDHREEKGMWDGRDTRVIVGERTIVIPTSGDLITPPPTQGSGDGLPEIAPEEPLGGVETIVLRLYVDRTSYLPIASTQEQRLNGEPVDDLGDPVLVYEHEFLPITDELADLFDPRLFGYQEE